MPLPEFWNASPIEAQDYFDWYVSTVQDRLSELIALYRSTGGLGELDFSFASLQRLASWLKENVEFRCRDDAEIEAARPTIPSWLADSLRVPILTNYWYNQSANVGTYLGELFIKQYPFLSWKLSAAPRKNANFGQPVLQLKSGMELPPIMIAHTFMAGIQRTPDPANRLVSICALWRGNIEKEL